MLRAILLLVAVSLLVTVTDAALPGSRYGAAIWTPPGSLVYIYGGYGIGTDSGQPGNLNDMWAYNYEINSWSFIAGSSDVYVSPVYGESGTTTSSNTPGGMSFACPFYTNDNLWLFGGSASEGVYSDLWQFTLPGNQWMWISGPQAPNVEGVYTDFGTVSSDLAYPGARASAMCWTDLTNNVFGFFGGIGFGERNSNSGRLSDLWVYTPENNKWGWLTGNSDVDVSITPGPQEEPSTTIFPSGTSHAGSWVYTPPGEVYLYFGLGSVATSDYSDELWRYKVATYEWTIMKNNEDWNNAITNRTGAAIWGSPTEGSAWIFGGQGFDAQGGIGYLGDLHFYSADNNAYSQVGPDATQSNGVYGEKGVPSSNNYPGSRAYAATWTDSRGNLWLFGGIGFGSDGGDTGLLNDVWKYDVSTREWTWIGGSQYINTPGDYDPKATEPGVQLPPDAPANQNPAPDFSPIASPSSSVGAPTSQNTSALTADQQIGLGVGLGVGVPLVAGAIILVVFIQKRKAGKGDKTTKKTGSSDSGAKNSTADPEQGNYNSIPTINSTTTTNYGQINAVALDNSSVTADAKIGGADNRFIPYSSVTLEKEIGVGSYGKVYLGKLRTTKVAVKVANTKISQEEFIREANFQLSIPPHPNIVQLLGISIDGPEPLVVLEYCNEGSLDKLLFESEKNWTPAEQINLAAAIARGLDHLHQINIVHRDLAVRNILLHHGEPKISDFGMSRKLKEASQVGKTATNIGPIRWMAPEALAKQTYSTKSDIWTFGILLYEIVARQEPHADEDLINVAVKIRDNGYTPNIPENCPELLREIMQMCWKADPAERPEMSIICEKLDIK